MPGTLRQLAGSRFIGNTGKDSGAFEAYAIKLLGLETKNLKDSRPDLYGADIGGNPFRRVGWIREQNHYIGVVVRETAMFGKFLCATGVDHAGLRLNSDIWSTWIAIRGSPGLSNIV